jgi:hypothetical protein
VNNELDTVYSTPRYMLAIGPDSYLLLDRQAMEQPMASFPLTDEGFDAAEARFAELKRLERRERGMVPRTVAIGVFIGVALWILGGLGVAILGSLTFGIDADQSFLQLVYLVDAFGFRIAIGGLITLGVILLLRWERKSPPSTTRQDGRAPSAEAPEPRNAWDTVSTGTLVTGLVLWILLAIATQALFPFQGEFFTFGEEPPGPSRLTVMAQLAESLAFRIWVAAFIFKLVRWSRRPFRAASSE